MFDQKKYIEFCKEKYNEIKLIISNSFSMQMKMEIISDFDMFQQVTSFEISEEYRSIWKDLVEFVKGIEDGTIDNDLGIMIEQKHKNSYSVPQDIRSPWQILKKGLISKKIYSHEEIDSLEKGTVKILNNLSINTQGEEPVKGMIMGYVQSGKTTSIESLISMAASWGWNVFIMLSGTIENLRIQNLNRLQADIECRKNGNIHWKFNPDFKLDKAYELINSDKRIVMVSLKNSTRLKQLKKWLFAAGGLSMQKAKILVIDDEADQASLNTCNITKEERSKINELITDLVDNHLEEVGAMNYVGYTATPYGNFLNEFGSIYPKDFIYMLPKSNKYIGPQEIFGYADLADENNVDGLDIKRIINENEYKDILELGKETNSFKIPFSLKKAICWFIITLAISRYKDNKSPVSMLIHMHRKTDIHKIVSETLSNWLKSISRDKIMNLCSIVYNEETSRFTINDFYSVMQKYDREIENYPSFDELIPYINEILDSKLGYMKVLDDGKIEYTKGIHMVIDNCNISKSLDDNQNPRLAYPKKEDNIDYATGFIIVGGDTLSRGLTIEGLTTTYFCRKVGQVDTLMQMGRWFGYRIGYELLPRLWIDEDNLNKFIIMTDIELDLRNDLEKYELGSDPKECGPAIKQSFNSKLKITSKSKSQSMVEVEMDYGGENPQTYIFDENKNIQNDNIDITNKFIDKLGDFKPAYRNNNYLKENVDFEIIKQYLLKFNFCSETSFFNNISAFCDWIEQVDADYLKKWNVIIANNTQSKTDNWKFGNNCMVGKTVRSKYTENEKPGLINIKVLRGIDDVLSDVPKDKNVDLSSAKSKLESRKKIKVPQLIIYKIDGKGISNKKGKYRADLNLDYDIIGLYLFIPGDHYKGNVKKVSIKIPKLSIEVGGEDL